MMRERSRSRSAVRSRQHAPSERMRERQLETFAHLYWSACNPAEIMRFRDGLLSSAEAAVHELRSRIRSNARSGVRVTVSLWQRFVFFENLYRMTEVLLHRCTMPRRADDVDVRLHSCWQIVEKSIWNAAFFADAVSNFRVSSVQLVMMLETLRPLEAAQHDGGHSLPCARTLASLMSVRCDRDCPDEVAAIEKLVKMKLEGQVCGVCNASLGQSSVSCEEAGVVTTRPSIVIPQCGHAIHSVCFMSQLVPDAAYCHQRGSCKQCGCAYGFESLERAALVNTFCATFGPQLDECLDDMCEVGVELWAKICSNFCDEVGGNMSPANAWRSLLEHCEFESSLEQVELVSLAVLQKLLKADSERQRKREKFDKVVVFEPAKLVTQVVVP